MATIHITEIQRILAERGEVDALPFSSEGFFVEIRFDQPGRATKIIDEEMKNKVITADSAYGSVTIQFDQNGELTSLDLS